MKKFKEFHAGRIAGHYEKHAAHLNSIAKRLHGTSDAYKGKDDDLHRLYKSDAKDYKHLADLVQRKNVKTAARRWSRLDTASRDHLGQSTFELFRKHF
jgi:hypothetical protein